MNSTMTFTHYGWYGFCPVYCTESQDSLMLARFELHRFLKFNGFIAQMVVDLASFFNPYEEFLIPVRIRGKLENPYTVSFVD